VIAVSSCVDSQIFVVPSCTLAEIHREERANVDRTAYKMQQFSRRLLSASQCFLCISARVYDGTTII
jgi:hypothetical protein